MQGRESGDPGGELAAEYIISKLKSWGLEPGGPQGKYYQDMTFEYIKKQRGGRPRCHVQELYQVVCL